MEIHIVHHTLQLLLHMELQQLVIDLLNPQDIRLRLTLEAHLEDYMSQLHQLTTPQPQCMNQLLETMSQPLEELVDHIIKSKKKRSKSKMKVQQKIDIIKIDEQLL